MSKKVILIIAVILMVWGVAIAEEKKMTPEETQAQVQQTMQMMTPMFGQMMKVMMEAQLEVLANPASADKLASYTKNYYDALIKKGFSKEDALRIVLAVGFPALPTMQK